MNERTQNAVSIEHVSRRYGSRQALEDVTLEVRAGGVLGLVGANGAGKTTLIRHILGLLKPQKGKVRVFGLDPVKNSVAVLSRLGYLSEDRDLPPWVTVSELLRYNQAFYPRWDQAYAEELRTRFQLPSAARVRNLSKGELAKAGLLVALAHRPELLVLDEPSSGLDPVVRKEILEAIVRAVGDEGRTVLFSSHLLDEIARVSDRVVMLANGRLVLEGDLHGILESHRRLVLRLPANLAEELARSVAPAATIPGKQTATPAIASRLPGMLSLSGGPEEWTVICNGQYESLLRNVNECGGQVLESSGATFEEIFHARMTQGGPASV